MSSEKYKQDLLALISQVKDKASLDKLLCGLLSPKEYDEINKRWQIIKQLHQGFSQRQISNNLKVSITTVTRGSRVWSDKNSIFHRMLKR